MSIGVSIFLIVIGAILAFAVDVDAQGFSINTIGWILMIVGGLGALLSFAFWTGGRRFGGDRAKAFEDRP